MKFRKEFFGGSSVIQLPSSSHYLENSYSGARMVDDESCQIRLARAIAAFKADPREDVEDLFTEKFVNKYVIETGESED